MLLITIVMDRSGIMLVDILGLHTFFSPDFRVWQLFTNIFLHGDITHLFFNMFSLWMFGRILEQVWGGKKFLIYFLATGVGASILNSLVNIAEIEILRRSAEETLANDDVVIIRAAQLPNQLNEVVRFVPTFFPHQDLSQERMLKEKPFISLAHHEVDGRIRVKGMQLLQDTRGQHGITEEGGLYDEELLGWHG